MEFWYIEALASRILGRLPDFHDYRSKSFRNEFADRLPTLRENEGLIGLYENTPGEILNTIVLSDQALWLFTRDGWIHVDFNDIYQIKGPTKEEVRGVDIVLHDGAILDIPVRGARRQIRDAFSFMRFLMRVTEKIAKDKD